MSHVDIPQAALVRLRARYAAFQETAQTIVDALGYGEVQGVSVNLDQGVLEVPDAPNGVAGPLAEAATNGR